MKKPRFGFYIGDLKFFGTDECGQPIVDTIPDVEIAKPGRLWHWLRKIARLFHRSKFRTITSIR